MKISVLPRSRGSEVCFQFPASQSVTTALSEGNKNVMIIICIVSRNNCAGFTMDSQQTLYSHFPAK